MSFIHSESFKQASVSCSITLLDTQPLEKKFDQDNERGNLLVGWPHALHQRGNADFFGKSW